MKPRILLVHSDETVRKILQSRLERDGFEVAISTTAEDARARMSQDGYIGVLVTDLKLPGQDGFSLLSWVKDRYPQIRSVIVTERGEKGDAVKAFRMGASDYFEQPLNLDDFSQVTARCTSEYQSDRDNQFTTDRLAARAERVEGKAEDRFWYVSQSPAMAKVNEWITVLRREAMRGDSAEEASVLILGETGTGKEGIARMVNAGSRRAKGPWVTVNCAEFTGDQALESEFFGHEQGAFPGATTTTHGVFEIARGGTLFLDEVGVLSAPLQAKLLGALREKAFHRIGGTENFPADVRVIAATTEDLYAKAKDGAFREDLYQCISGVIIEMPALRDRLDDIVPMATQFAERAFRAHGKTFRGFSPEAEAAVRAYAWPGNVRELLTVVEHAALVRGDNGPLTFKDLSISDAAPAARCDGPRRLELVQSPFQSPSESGAEGFMELKKKWLDQFERDYLVAALARHDGNVSSAAREAKIDRSNFLRLLRRHQVKAQEYRKAA